MLKENDTTNCNKISDNVTKFESSFTSLSTKSRKSNIGDMFITKDEIIDVFLDGKRNLFHKYLNQTTLLPVKSTLSNSDAYILREVIPVIRKIYQKKD